MPTSVQTMTPATTQSPISQAFEVPDELIVAIRNTVLAKVSTALLDIALQQIQSGNPELGTALIKCAKGITKDLSA